MSTQLTTVLSDAGLEQSSTDLILSKFNAFDLQASEWMDKAKALVVSDVTEIDKMKEARTARLALRKIRTEADKTRKELKEESLRYGKAVQGVYNFMEAKIKPIEEHLQKQEDFAKIKEQERIEAIREERERLVEDLREFVGYGDDFGLMSEVAFQALLKSAKQQQADQIAQNEAAIKAQAEAVERDRLEQIRIREENERLRAEAAARAEADRIERELAEAERRKADEAARVERERVEAERRKLEAEKLAAQAELDRIKAEERARVEQEAADALAREKAEQEATRKAKAAPDKAKALAYIKANGTGDSPDVSDPEVHSLLADFDGQLEAMIKDYTDKISSL